MAPTPSPSSKMNQFQFKTPQSKHRLNFNATRTPNPHPSPNLNCTAKEAIQQDHPIEVVGRIRDLPERKKKDKPPQVSILQANHDSQTLRVRAEIGYRDFTLDGVSFSEEEDLDSFYKKFVQARIKGVKLGSKCTLMMYGPTGSGKSHTMFGCGKQAGIVYRALKDILGDGGGGEDGSEGDKLAMGTFVQVTVLEIYNEEIYDLLSSNGGNGSWCQKGGSGSKVRVEVMGKKAKNAAFLSGTDAGKISREIQKVEKRRIVKSTLCNDRSSRSHCMIILDVPTVGGRLMLVDMAGSENIEQAGQIGFEAKMQTAKINQGNIALKRVVESIANGDSHVPFRDSKLTMLLQDSFEDDMSKILMILCASPDPKEIHKTICTLEYGAKAKCIVRGPHTPLRDKFGSEDSSAVMMGSRIVAMDQFIHQLQVENKLKEKEKKEAHKQLMKKEEEVAKLRALIDGQRSTSTEEEIKLKVNERANMLEVELERKLEECRRMVEESVELERRRMEERTLQQQQEVEMLRRRLEQIELELRNSKDENTGVNVSTEKDGNSFARRLLGEACADDGSGMVKSMDLDMGEETCFRDVRYDHSRFATLNTLNEVGDQGLFLPTYGGKMCLSTVYEEEEAEEEEDHQKKVEDEEVEKRVIDAVPLTPHPQNAIEDKGTASSRQLRIQNIFTLCGNQRELSHHVIAPALTKTKYTDSEQPSPIVPVVGEDAVLKDSSKENSPLQKDMRTITGLVKDLSDIMTLASKENNDPSKENRSLTPVVSKLQQTPIHCLSQLAVGDDDLLLSPKLAAHLSTTPFINRRRGC